MGGTGNKEKIEIKNDANRLSPEDVERMIKDAEDFAEEDKKVAERAVAKNELEHTSTHSRTKSATLPRVNLAPSSMMRRRRPSTTVLRRLLSGSMRMARPLRLRRSRK